MGALAVLLLLLLSSVNASAGEWGGRPTAAEARDNRDITRHTHTHTLAHTRAAFVLLLLKQQGQGVCLRACVCCRCLC